ncbi:MAG: hypothetical protein K2Q14_08345 [Gammaproteobacteria bacterium]|nr:hypothetical protein [Gammaproteobacteria bacterium]
MNTKKTLLLGATLLACSTTAFAWLANSQTGLVPVVVPVTMQCPVEYYNVNLDRTFLASQEEVASYVSYHQYLDTQWGLGAMTYPEYLVQHPIDVDVVCPGNGRWDNDTVEEVVHQHVVVVHHG